MRRQAIRNKKKLLTNNCTRTGHGSGREVCGEGGNVSFGDGYMIGFGTRSEEGVVVQVGW